MHFIVPHVGRAPHCCATCGVRGGVVVPHVGHRRRLCTMCGFAVTVIAPCVVSGLRALCRVGIAVAVFVPCGCHSHGCHTVWCCGRGGCHHATWCHSCGHCHHIVTEPQKRKLVEKRKKKTYKQADTVHAAGRGMATRCHRSR